MKTKVCGWMLAGLLWVGVAGVRGQSAIVASLSQNGVLSCANLQPGSTAVVQWASSLSGPWFTNWTAQNAVAVGTNGSMTVSVPMFYRVLGLAASKAIDADAPVGNAILSPIPAGVFTMGDNLDGESDANPTNTYVSAFSLDQKDVTEALWKQVYLWATNRGYQFDSPGSALDLWTKGPNYPVVDVNWYDCVKWCNARSEMEKRTPAYYLTAYTNGMYADTNTIYRKGDLDLTNACVNWTAGYRLPTEAEWEKAARGGLGETNGLRFPWGNYISESQANYYSGDGFPYDLSDTGFNPAFDTGGDPYTSPVGSFPTNGYGLYDMAGNVWQWCWDWYGTSYVGGFDPHGPPAGPTINGFYHVIRGGSWYDSAFGCRSANRNYLSPGNTANNGYYYGYYYFHGFRCALPAGQ